MKRSNAIVFAGAILFLVGSFMNAGAQEESTPPIQQVLIQNVSVWDGTSDAAVPGQDVLVEGNLIKSIGQGLSAGDTADVIDGGGFTVIPGIIDAHTHLASPISPDDVASEDPAYVAALSLEVSEMLLMRGWTTMRDVGGPSQGLARAIDEGHAIGPRIYPSAMFITQTSGHGDSRKLMDPHPNMGGNFDAFAARYDLIADGPAEVRRAVRESLRQGAVQIKVMAGGGISSDYDPFSLQ